MAWHPGGGDKLNQEIFDALAAFINQMDKQTEQITDEFAVPLSCLKALHLADTVISMKELGRRMGCDPSFVTTLADALEERHLATRQPNITDRRAKNLVLTTDGIAMKSRLERMMLGRALWFRLEITEQESFLELVRKMTRSGPPSPAPPTQRRGCGRW